MAHTENESHQPTHGAVLDPGPASAAHAAHGHGLLPGEHPERHEHSDVPTRPLLIFMAVMIVLAVAIHVGLYFLFHAYDRAEQRRDLQRVRSAVARDRLEKLPAEPRIQGVPEFHATTPRQDTNIMKSENARALTTYSQDAQGVTRIPIDRAIDIVARKGLPTTRPALGGQNGQ